MKQNAIRAIDARVMARMSYSIDGFMVLPGKC
jgi:hypothetical protein